MTVLNLDICIDVFQDSTLTPKLVGGFENDMPKLLSSNTDVKELFSGLGTLIFTMLVTFITCVLAFRLLPWGPIALDARVAGSRTEITRLGLVFVFFVDKIIKTEMSLTNL